MLDAIIAKALAKTVDERYQSAAELARDLRACERALTTAATAPATGAGAHGFSAGARPSLVDTDAKAGVLTQLVVHTRASDAATAPQAESPARGVARAFDSNEATMRLAALTSAAPGIASAVELSAPTVLQPAWRRWSRRDTAAVALAAVTGLLAAALILGA